MKTRVKIFSIALLSVIFIATACNNAQQREENNDNTEQLHQNRQEALANLRADINRLEANIDATLRDKPDDFQDRMQESLDNIKERIDDFEDQMNETGEAIDAQTQRAINNMKRETQQLNDRLDTWSDSDWEEFKADFNDGWDDFKKEMRELTDSEDNGQDGNNNL